jgi:hypothetical protein
MTCSRLSAFCSDRIPWFAPRTAIASSRSLVRFVFRDAACPNLRGGARTQVPGALSRKQVWQSTCSSRRSNVLRLSLHPEGLAPRMTTFSSALDVTVAELSIESFYPADPHTAQGMSSLLDAEPRVLYSP